MADRDLPGQAGRQLLAGLAMLAAAWALEWVARLSVIDVVPTVHPVAGMVAGALILTPPRTWPILVVAALAGTVLAWPPVWPLAARLGLGGLMVVQALVGVALLRRFLWPLRLDRVRHVLVFAVWLGLVVPATAGLAAATVLEIVDPTRMAKIGGPWTWVSEWETWLMVEAASIVVITPLMLVAAGRRSDDLRRAWRCHRRVLGVLVPGLAAYVLVTVLMPWDSPLLILLPYAALPLALWAATILGLAGAAGSVAVLAVGAALPPLLHGHALPGDGTPLWHWTLHLQGFMISVGLGALLVQAAVAERDHHRRLAGTDPLTGVSNRRHFEQMAAAAVEQDGRLGRPTAVLMLDIDHFKAVNDTHGHAAGDAALRHLCHVLRQHERDGDILGRVGGEEFALVLPDTDAASAAKVADRLRRAVAGAEVRHLDLRFSLTVSIGVAVLGAGEGGPAFTEALAQADQALYQAKETGRNRVCFSGSPGALPSA